VVKTLVCFHEVLGSILDGCMFNVSRTNAIYKHIHHGDYTNMYITLKWYQNTFVYKIKIIKTN